MMEVRSLHSPPSRAALALATLVLSALSYTATADEPSASASAGWATIEGGPGTGCATDATAYEFYVRAADPRRVAIYFQGGGGCWNSRNCGLDGQRTFENAVDDSDRPWLKYGTGIFDVANPRNPLKDFTIILAPYCTADLHLGVRSGRFDAADGKHLDVHYRGLANAQRVVGWVTAQYANPKLLFVAGGSAGAISSPVFASQLARHYPDAKVVQLGDGAGAYRTVRVAAPLSEWGATTALKHDPLFRGLDPATTNFESFYVRAATVPNLRLAQVNTVEDRVQVSFLGQVGHQVATLSPLLSGNLAELRQSDRKLRTYTMPGTMHEILRRPELYTTKVDDVDLTTWVDDLIQGRRVDNVGDALLQPPAARLQ